MKKKLLLHVCCAPCLCGVFEELCDKYDITLFYYNPNIYPQDEYNKRADALKEYLNKISKTKVNAIIENYSNTNFFDAVMGLENEPENGKRCEICYKMRLEKTAQFAKDNNFDLFTTTLSISPYKNAKKLNEIGYDLQDKYNIEYLYADFKKNNGYLKSIQNSKQYNIYRQNYCGCKFSMPNNL